MLYGWERGIRTPVDGVRVRSPAAGRSPNLLCLNDTKCLLVSQAPFIWHCLAIIPAKQSRHAVILFGAIYQHRYDFCFST